jgi:hypothetical protein
MEKFGNILVYVVLLATACSVARAEELLRSGWDYECSFDGERHAHEIACDRYYECRVNGIGGWNIFLYRCPYGYQYSDLFNTCLQGFCGGPVSTTETGEPTTTVEPITDYTETEEPINTDYPETEEPTTTDYPETEEPTTTDYPETEEPTTTDYPETEEPTTDFPETEEPINTDYPETEEPTTTDYPQTEEPTTDYPETEEPTTDYPETEEPTTDYPETEEPTTDYPETEEPTTADYPETDEPTTVVPEFVCVKNGYFTDPLNCAVFHHCVCDSNGQCTDNVKQCPVNYHFCEEYQTCGTDDFCPCTTPYRGFYYY